MERQFHSECLILRDRYKLMYIKKVQVTNLRIIDSFEMNFEDSPGWHVLIGENGAGKSTVLKAISLALIGPEEAQSLRIVFTNWVQRGKSTAEVKLNVIRDECDEFDEKVKLNLKDSFAANIQFQIEQTDKRFTAKINSNKVPYQYLWGNRKGWFSVGYGPYRKFNNNTKDASKIYESNPKAAAHLSIFGENIAFTETLDWLSFIKYQTYENNQEAVDLLAALKKFINEGDLLPNNTELYDISSDGVTFVDGNHNYVDVTQLSDGYRSVLSMIFELLRQLVRVYGEVMVFENITKGIMKIDVPGVVLIDEIDAHLHPTWQTQIGQWFTKYFPRLQFIVTTHSPLICRASEKGSIWRLAAPGSNDVSGEVQGIDRDRLIYGNVLDAFGTETFGKDVEISNEAIAQKLKLIELTKKHISGKISEEETKEFERLKSIFVTDDPIEL